MLTEYILDLLDETPEVSLLDSEGGGIRRIVLLIHLAVPHSVFLREESCVGPTDTWYVIPRRTPSHHTRFPGFTNTRDGA